MTYLIEIKNVDELAYIDIQNIVQRNLTKIDGMVSTGEGSGVFIGDSAGITRDVFCIERA